jgi:hypothetical protein
MTVRAPVRLNNANSTPPRHFTQRIFGQLTLPKAKTMLEKTP